MERQKRWQLALIVAVILLTIYNILPTLFFYSKPLKSAVSPQQAQSAALQMVQRVDALELETIDWLKSFCKNLGIKPLQVSLLPDDPGLVSVQFSNDDDAKQFAKLLPAAGEMIPFAPAQLSLAPNQDLHSPSATVLIERRIGVHLDSKDVPNLFHYSAKFNEQGEPEPLYRALLVDRLEQVALALGGESRQALQLQAFLDNSGDSSEQLASIAQEIRDIHRVFGARQEIANRLYSHFALTQQSKEKRLLTRLKAKLEVEEGRLSSLTTTLKQSIEKKQKENALVDASLLQKAERTQELQAFAKEALYALNQHAQASENGLEPYSAGNIRISFEKEQGSGRALSHLSLRGRHPLFEALTLDWAAGEINFKLYPDVEQLLTQETQLDAENYVKEQLQSLVVDECAHISRLTGESISQGPAGFYLSLQQLPSSQAILALDLAPIAEKGALQIADALQREWRPLAHDLNPANYPIRDYDQYSKESALAQKLGMVVIPSVALSPSERGALKPHSLYVVAKGLDALVNRWREDSQSGSAKQLMDDFDQLFNLMQRKGFIGYSGSTFGKTSPYAKDFIFELSNYYSDLLEATRESFTILGSKRYAVLELADYEQRLLTENRIADQIQEELLKAKELYQGAQVELNPVRRKLVPPPTKNSYVENAKLSLWKYFRGDDQRILRWGLDLSGGKTVRIALRDHNNKLVTAPEDLQQAVNELYVRINKMGVAERTIRIENQTIVLEFPGSQALSAKELIQASAMYFHIVNEKFSTANPECAEAVNRFLQGVWNEAVVTHATDMASLNEIAFRHLGGSSSAANAAPLNDAAKRLIELGLQLDPHANSATAAFNDTLSMVARYRGDDHSEWHGQNHPLLFVFRNYALAGANLESVQAGYDPSSGNVLSFSVRGSYAKEGAGSPRDDFYHWTSQFAETKISGTPREEYSKGRGWRMAVILNGNVISSPTLNDALRERGMISGNFSQREASQLASDLRAGSLSFTPEILSELNISPELGQQERLHGIQAALIGLSAVMLLMGIYYRFAGWVAAIAVLFNLLIMWGVLQNIGAALTLPGIAGIVLTIGMAVDANVLVFERIREEFALSGRLAPAIQLGYKKAFSAIIDSNITTIIAALILIQFDSGPIRGFAITLIIGIVSSMFTALFMTRYFFTEWSQKPGRTLEMRSWIQTSQFDFLSKSPIALALALAICLLGSFLFYNERHTIFGMDFTGGYSLVVDLKEETQLEKTPANYRDRTIDALAAAGISPTEMQVREMGRPNLLRLQLSRGLEQPGHAFYQLPERVEGQVKYPFNHHPRIEYVVKALAQKGLLIEQSKLTTLDQQWSTMSGQFSSAMRANAIWGLVLSLLSILLYLTLRFEWDYAMAAVCGLAHDVLVALAFVALFHWLGFAVDIDLQVVGALMTIIGYSLNDTIIVFDRIREDSRALRKLSFRQVVNHALNVTLSRTLMTSLTTLAALISLVTLGGQTIFAFSFVMTIGVVVGTLSSLFISAPILIYLREQKNSSALTVSER